MHRKENLKTFSTILGKPINSLENQLLFMLEELNPESEFYQLLPSYKGYISSDFLQATTPRQAAESFCFLYTRADCTPENLNLRCNLAQKIYNTYN